jgi:hypothetical protein
MTMLTHTGNRFEPASHSSRRRDTATPAGAHLAVFKRACLCAFTALLVGGGVAGIISLKTAIALSRLSY